MEHNFWILLFILVLFTAAPTAAAVFGKVIGPLKSMYGSLSSHKFDLIRDVLNLMLLLSYFPFDSSFISTQFLVLNLDGWFVVSSTQRTFHVESTSNWRGYYVDTLNTKFRRISTSFPCHFHFFDVISLIEKFTSFPRTFFDVNLIAEESTLFTSTFFDEILMN